LAHTNLIGKISFILDLEAVNWLVREELGSRSRAPRMPNFDITCRRYRKERFNISVPFTVQCLLCCAV